MMEGCPLKFRLIELFGERGTLWNYEIVKQVQIEYGMENDYGRDVLNYDLIEIMASGFIAVTDMKEDDEGIFKKGALLTQYEITSLGRLECEEIMKKAILRR
ncbi:MAG: hypothetical protein FWF07_01955 [Methanomassiliicoccaceae archaeon]|nr:hypothetical protein [Methanomassiliicoccaceae archaeon]